jgi:hypothetical protein
VLTVAGRLLNREHNLKVDQALHQLVTLDSLLASIGIEANLFKKYYEKVTGKRKSM